MQQSQSSQRIGVIVAQLGTPDAPTARAVRPYLREFLSDMRVIDYHPLLWQPILRGIILTMRPRKSAKLYARIWMKEGSPLLVYSQRQVTGLQKLLGDNYRVILGMTYGNPGMRAAVQTLESEGIDRIVVLPMYPQYASTTTASVYDMAYKAAAGRRCPFFNERKRFVPTLRFVEPYFDHPGYINALRQRVDEAVTQWDRRPDHYLWSYHGNPQRYIDTGDPYQAQCEVTSRLLAKALGLNDDQWSISFQSQFGPEEWLKPATDEILRELHGEGIENVLVFAPGFTADCLETLDELGNEGVEQFEEGGGHAEGFKLVPCLNDHPAFIDTLAHIVRNAALGWVPATAS